MSSRSCSGGRGAVTWPQNNVAQVVHARQGSRAGGGGRGGGQIPPVGHATWQEGAGVGFPAEEVCAL